jgi:two-component sensor histidine kinase
MSKRGYFDVVEDKALGISNTTPENKPSVGPGIVSAIGKQLRGKVHFTRTLAELKADR